VRRTSVHAGACIAGADTGSVNGRFGVAVGARLSSKAAHKQRHHPRTRGYLRKSPPAGRANEAGLVSADIVLAVAVADIGPWDKRSSLDHATLRTLPTLKSRSSAGHHGWRCRDATLHSLVVQTFQNEVGRSRAIGLAKITPKTGSISARRTYEKPSMEVSRR